jgi:hypothetical protein
LRSSRSGGSTGEEDIVFIYLKGKRSKPEGAEVVAAFVSNACRDIQALGTSASTIPEID